MSGYSHIFHPLSRHGSLPAKLNNPFFYEPDPLALAASHELQAHLAQSEVSSMEEGKMFGVLVVVNDQSSLGYLAAYSGQMEGLDEAAFVPPVFSYLQPEGYFLSHEREIVGLSRRIAELESSAELRQARERLAEVETKAKAILAEKIKIREEAKQRRDRLRATAHITAEEHEAMVAESQFLKAEVKRARLQYAQSISEAQSGIDRLTSRIEALRDERHERSEQLQRWLFSHFVMLNGRGERADLLKIFADYYASTSLPANRLLPPSGSGECCEPKLLQYAFLHHLRPVSMAMFWWGASPTAEVRHHLHFYPACSSKCKPILSFMLQGVEVEENRLESAVHVPLPVVAEGEGYVVVDKPEGMLSVPGKGKRESVLSILRRRYPEAMVVHRLDMGTSGLLLVATNYRSYVALQRQFLEHRVKKKYVAVAEGVPDKKEGCIRLPLSPDLNDRPRQKVDFQNGKEAVTLYRVIKSEHGETLLELCPLTGRTHQLRVHCAHAKGLGCPIKGDTLYGSPASRLWLHAGELSFFSPVSGEAVSVKSVAPFLRQRTSPASGL